MSLVEASDDFQTGCNDEAVADDEEVDLLAIDFFGEGRCGHFAPSLADNLQIGVVQSDQYTQTNVDEILDIKLVTESVKDLKKEMAEARKEFKFIEQVMSATFEDQIEVKAFQLQSRLMERMQNLQKLHEKRIDVVRRSYKQQLQDALVKIAAQYKTYYETKRNDVPAEFSKLTTEDKTSKYIIAELQKDLQKVRTEMEEKDTEIMQLKQDLMAASLSQDRMFVENTSSQIDEMIDEKNRELDESNKKAHAMKSSIEKLQKEINQLNQNLRSKDREVHTLHGEVANLQKKIAKQAAVKPELSHSKPIKHAAPKPTPKPSKVHQTTTQVGGVDSDKYEAVLNELMSVREEMDQKVQEAVVAERNQNNVAILNLRKDVAALTDKIELSERGHEKQIVEIERHAIVKERNRWLKMQKRWEKKFNILRASLHAIKDEAYVRGQLQKQTVNIKYASVNYAGAADPLYFDSPSPQHSYFERRTSPNRDSLQSRRVSHPLPAKQLAEVIAEEEKYLPLAEVEAFFKDDQDPIDDDDDENYAKLVPLPDKPNFGSYMPPSRV